jgi:hypothetical protein
MLRAPLSLAAGGLVLGCSGLNASAIARTAPVLPSTQTDGGDAAEGQATNAPAPSPPSSAELPAPAAVAWATLYARYFGPNSDGRCAGTGACHARTMSDADSAYAWLASRGYISGTRSALVSPTNSCLRWFGGNMPPHGRPNESAVRDLTAWVAAGAAND